MRLLEMPLKLKISSLKQSCLYIEQVYQNLTVTANKNLQIHIHTQTHTYTQRNPNTTLRLVIQSEEARKGGERNLKPDQTTH